MEIDDDLRREFEELGAALAPGTPVSTASEGFDVMPVNWISVCTWLACETQWRVAAGLAGLIWLGLDYTAVDVVMRRSRADDAVFDDLLVMETEALATFNEAGE